MLIITKLIIKCNVILIQTPTILAFRGEYFADKSFWEADSLSLNGSACGLRKDKVVQNTNFPEPLCNIYQKL